MARQLGNISITISADKNGKLLTTGHMIRYDTCDDLVDSGLREGGVVPLDEIIGTDTIDEWWAKVQAQITKKHRTA